MKCKYLLLILFSFVFQEFAYSQDQPLLDSLEKKLQQFEAHKLEMHGKTPEPNDTVKVNLLFELSKTFWYSDFDKGIDYANQSLHLAEQISFKKGIVHAYYTMGVINYIKGNYALGMEQSKKSLSVAVVIDDKLGIADAFINIGNIEVSHGNYAEGFKYYFASLKIAEQIGYKMGVVYNYSNIANIYSLQGNYAEALKYYFASLKIKKEIGDKLNMAADYSNIANIYIHKGKYSEALKYFSEALKINKEVGNKIWESSTYGSIGIVYEKQGKYLEAQKNYFIALKGAKAYDDKSATVVWRGNIGYCYIKLKKYPEARKYLNDGFALAKEMGFKEYIKNSYNDLTELDSATGNWKSAYENHKLFKLYSDSLLNEENTKSIVQASMQKEFDEKEIATKAAQEKKDALAKAEVQKQRIIKYAGFGGLIVVLLFALSVYKRFSEKRKANIVLENTLQNLKETQAQLIQSEKMAAFGVMAQRVAHEIRNPLNFVHNFSEISQQLAHEIINEDNEDVKKETVQLLLTNLQKIIEHSKRADGIIKELQAHTRAGTTHEFFEEDKT